jgi:hypothetical protein
VKAGRVCTNFTTPTPHFKPTFKVGRSTETTYNGKRLPSYCDRVLLKSRAPVKHLLACHAFGGCHKFSTSVTAHVQKNTAANAPELSLCSSNREALLSSF